MTVNCKIVMRAKEERIWIKWLEAKVNLNPNRPLDYYALTNFGINPTISRHGIAQARLALLIWLNAMVLFGICLPVSRLQWSPIAPSKREHIFSKIEVVIIITLMTDLGLLFFLFRTATAVSTAILPCTAHLHTGPAIWLWVHLPWWPGAWQYVWSESWEYLWR